GVPLTLLRRPAASAIGLCHGLHPRLGASRVVRPADRERPRAHARRVEPAQEAGGHLAAAVVAALRRSYVRGLVSRTGARTTGVVVDAETSGVVAGHV